MKNNKMPTTLLDFPPEIIMIISTLLKNRDLSNFSKTCKYINELVNHLLTNRKVNYFTNQLYNEKFSRSCCRSYDRSYPSGIISCGYTVIGVSKGPSMIDLIEKMKKMKK